MSAYIGMSENEAGRNGCSELICIMCVHGKISPGDRFS